MKRQVIVFGLFIIFAASLANACMIEPGYVHCTFSGNVPSSYYLDKGDYINSEERLGSLYVYENGERQSAGRFIDINGSMDLWLDFPIMVQARDNLSNLTKIMPKLQDINTVCVEKMTATAYQQLTTMNKTCWIEAPGTYSPEQSIEGWAFRCYDSYSGRTGYGDMIEIFILTIIIYPLIFIAVPLLFIAWLFIYGVIIIRKHKAINAFILPVFFGLIDGIIASAIWRKQWKGLLLAGIVLAAAMFLIALVLFPPVYFDAAKLTC
jgi:hypothetical protein